VSEPTDTATDPIDRLLNALDTVLDAIHDRIIRPLLLVTRYLAFGFVFFVLLAMMVGTGLLGLVRFGNVFIFQGYVWLNYLVVGALSLLTGLLIWRRRRPAAVRKK
jgi:hypothetical protein